MAGADASADAQPLSRVAASPLLRLSRPVETGLTRSFPYHEAGLTKRCKVALQRAGGDAEPVLELASTQTTLAGKLVKKSLTATSHLSPPRTRHLLIYPAIYSAIYSATLAG
jgi:alpha-beta hydrolase superfamily lysophospholipase